MDVAVARVRAGFLNRNYKLRPNGRFAVLNVGRVRMVRRPITSGYRFRVVHPPLNVNKSHAGIFGSSEDDFSMAAELIPLVGHEDVHLSTL